MPIIRKNQEEKTKIGLLADKIVNDGGLLPDNIINEMVKQEINTRTDEYYSDEDYMPVPDDIDDDDPTIH